MMASPTKRKAPNADHDAYHSDETRTPTDAPPHKKLRITRSQKQALMDNLQLEITERARKLRAQYALQAHDLRARIERRVNRIPVALRKAIMGDLLEKNNSLLRSQQTTLSPRKHVSPGKRNITSASAKAGKQGISAASPSARRLKKQSHEGTYSDKENAPAAGESVDILKNPKRRANPGGTSRVVSQEVRGADYRILSPKSLNSRTYPQSPFRASPEKAHNSTFLSRPMSPLKPSSPLKATSASAPGATGNGRPRTTKATATAARETRPPSQAQVRRPASRATTTTKPMRSPFSRPATQLDRRGSISSTASSGTTVARPGRVGARKVTTASTASAPVKRTTVARNHPPSVAAKKATASTTRKATAPAGGEAPATGRRVLRKRA